MENKLAVSFRFFLRCHSRTTDLLLLCNQKYIISFGTYWVVKRGEQEGGRVPAAARMCQYTVFFLLNIIDKFSMINLIVACFHTIFWRYLKSFIFSQWLFEPCLLFYSKYSSISVKWCGALIQRYVKLMEWLSRVLYSRLISLLQVTIISPSFG